MIKYEWIVDDVALSRLCELLAREDAIAVDTEFMRSDTFYPIAALFQIAAASTGNGERCYLIDPLVIKDFTPLRQLLSDDGVVKIFHSCSEDLEVFKHFLGVVPTPLFDTQIAAALLNDGPAMSYSALVKQELAVDLPKDETRSNWLTRPLRAEQERYAALDVAYLSVVYRRLRQRLLAKGRLTWLQADCADLVTNALAEPNVDDYYKKIKSAWKLNAKQLNLLRALSLWREQTARRIDKPRNHVVHEKLLWEIAKMMPTELEPIKALMIGVWGRHKKWAQELWQICQQVGANGSPTDTLLLDPPLPLRARDLVKRLKAVVSEKSEELGLPSEVLAKKSDIELLIRSGLSNSGSSDGTFELPPRLLGWRREVIGDLLLTTANDSNRN